MPTPLARPSGARVGIVRRVTARGPLLDVAVTTRPAPAASHVVLLRPERRDPSERRGSAVSRAVELSAPVVDVEAPPLLCCEAVRAEEIADFTHLDRSPDAPVCLGDLRGPTQYALWEAFRRSLDPLRMLGQLGWVVFRFGDAFLPRQDNAAYLAVLTERLPDDRVAVDLPRTWLDDGELPHPALVGGGIRLCVDLARLPGIPDRIVDEVGVVLVPSSTEHDGGRDAGAAGAAGLRLGFDLRSLPPDAHVVFDVPSPTYVGARASEGVASPLA